MEYEERLPSPELARYVRCFWSLRGHAPEQSILPDGRTELVFHLGAPTVDRANEQTQAPSLLVGQMLTNVRIAGTGVLDVFGIRLQPAALACLIHLAPGEMRGTITSLADVSPAAHRALWNHLGETSVLSRRVDVAEAWLLAAIRRTPDSLAESYARSLRHDTNCSAGLSSRQMRRRFSAAVGLNPHLYARIARFQRVLRLLTSQPLAAIALETGYSDQAHLSRDFREFAGVSPRQWLSTTADRFLQDAFNGSEPC